jgi:hypothetical protein
MSTPDQEVAEQIGRSIDGRIFRLQEERAALGQAATRIAEIDAVIALLQVEKTRIDPRRPPRPTLPNATPGSDAPIVPPTRAR